MISPANTNPTVTDRGYPNVNRVCGRDDVQGVVGSEFAHGTMKAKSAYIIHDKTTYGQGVAEFFKADAEKKGIKILGFEGTEEKSNFDPILTTIKASLQQGEPVILRRFGTWHVHANRARVGRNPKTGAAAAIPARRVVRFTAGTPFKQAVDGAAHRVE